MFGTTVDALIAEPKEDNVKTVKNLTKKRIIISACSAGLVWLVAVVFFAFANMIFPNIKNSWLSFVIAIPINFIVLLSLTSVWGKSFINALFSSALIWTVITAIYVSLKTLLANPSHTLWMIYLIGIPLQVLNILWFSFKKVK